MISHTKRFAILAPQSQSSLGLCSCAWTSPCSPEMHATASCHLAKMATSFAKLPQNTRSSILVPILSKWFKIHSEVAILWIKCVQALTHGSYNSNHDCYEFLTRSNKQSLTQVLFTLFMLQGVMRSCHASPFRTMNMLLSRPLVSANPFGRNIRKPQENDEWLADTKLGGRPLAEWWPIRFMDVQMDGVCPTGR